MKYIRAETSDLLLAFVIFGVTSKQQTRACIGRLKDSTNTEAFIECVYEKKEKDSDMKIQADL